MQDIILMKNIYKSFGSVKVFYSLDFSLKENEFVCIAGKSGCGKSTLLRLIAGIENPDSGDIKAEKRIAISFQEPRLVPWLKVWKNVILGMNIRCKEQRSISLAALKYTGLEEKADAWPLQLSGGQAQRVSFARAIIRKPKLLLLDEPFGSLDALTRIEMQNLLKTIVKKFNLSVIMVTHDVHEAVHLADRVLVLDNGNFTYEVTIDKTADINEAKYADFATGILEKLS